MKVGMVLRKLRNGIVRVIPENSKLFRVLFLLGLRIRNRQARRGQKAFRVDLPVTEHCNLSCRCCTAFGPLAREEFLDVAQCARDLAQLKKLLRGEALGSLWFTGGEPLLHPKLTELFCLARQMFPETRMRLLTNGTLLSKQTEAFWVACRQNRVRILATRYPVQLPFAALQETAQQHRVSLSWLGGNSEPLKTMWKFPLDLTGGQPLSRSFRLCGQVNECVRLKDGILYPCNTIATIQHFNLYFGTDLALKPGDTLRLADVTDMNEVRQFLLRPKPFCRYCNRRAVQTGIPWGVSEREVQEWT